MLIKVKLIWKYAKLCLLFLAIGIIYGQFFQPIPLEKRTALPHMGIDDLNFSDENFLKDN